MRKDKPKASALSTANDQTTSFTQALKKLNKEAEKKEAAAEAMPKLCKICFKEVSPKRICGGHRGGGGGSDGTSAEKASPAKTIDEGTLAGEFSLIEGKLGPQRQADNDNFNPEIIAKLVANGLLVIDNDRKSMTLTLKLQCAPNSLSEEQRLELKKFIAAILKELNIFKEKNHISDACFNIIQDKEGNVLSLCITLPTVALYDAFIKQLANHLVPTPNPTLQAEDGLNKDQHVVPNPLSMQPTFSNRAKHSTQDEKETEDAKQDIFNPSPFSTKMRPW